MVCKKKNESEGRINNLMMYYVIYCISARVTALSIIAPLNTEVIVPRLPAKGGTIEPGGNT
jgi:hypothetical protein